MNVVTTITSLFCAVPTECSSHLLSMCFRLTLNCVVLVLSICFCFRFVVLSICRYPVFSDHAAAVRRSKDRVTDSATILTCTTRARLRYLRRRLCVLATQSTCRVWCGDRLERCHSTVNWAAEKFAIFVFCSWSCVVCLLSQWVVMLHFITTLSWPSLVYVFELFVVIESRLF